MTTERVTKHKPPHLDYGPCPKHFLEEDATPQDLYSYVESFFKNFSEGKPGVFKIGQGARQNEFVEIDEIYSPTLAFSLYFFRGHSVETGVVLRKYEVWPDHVDLIEASEEIKDHEDNHAFYISAHLRAAGILKLQEQGFQKPQGH